MKNKVYSPLVIHPDGGAFGIYTETNSSVICFIGCTFVKNLADFAGAFDFSNREGSAIIFNNTIVSNIAKKISNITGAGSVLQISGSDSTLHYYKQN